MKSGDFIITYLAPIKKFQKFQVWKFLDLLGPIFGPKPTQGSLSLRYVKFWVKTKLGCKFKKNRYLGSQLGFM